MRILLVNDYRPGEAGGTEVHLVRLAEELTNSGDQVEWFAGEVAHTGLRKVFDIWDPSARRSLARVAKRFRPEVIHYHNVIRELSASVFGATRGTAGVLTVHDLAIFGDPGVLFGPARLAVERLKRRFDVAVARANVEVAIGVSREIVGRLRAARFRNVVLMHNFAPADPPADVVAVAESNDVVFAGRLTVEKGVVVLAHAFAQIAHRHPAARLVLAGEGPERSSIHAAGIQEDRLLLTGQVPPERVRELMAHARVVVAPSTSSEGSPLAVIEAALLARPLVVSDYPGLRELVDEAGCGIVVPPSDAPALAAALDMLLSDPARATALGEEGWRTAHATRTPAVAVARIREIYAEAMRLARGRAAARTN